MKNRLLLVILLLCSFLTFGTSKVKKQLNIAVIYSVRGKGDKNRNDFAYEGLMKAKRDFGIEFKEFTQRISVIDIEYQLRSLAKSEKYDLIIGIPEEMRPGVAVIAKEFPKQKFVVTYSPMDEKLPNVATILFREEEGGFLAGALAAMTTKTYSVGFIGSAQTPNVRKYEKGFKQGAKYINEKLVTVSAYVEGESPRFDISGGKKKAEEMIKKYRTGVIFHDAGGSGIGVLNAAQENKIFAISSEQNEDKLAPGTVLTSIMTDLSTPIYTVVKNTANGNFQGREYYFGLSENAIKTTGFIYTGDKVEKENIRKFEEIKDMIKSGKIKVQK